MNNKDPYSISKEQSDRFDKDMNRSDKECADLLESALPLGNYDDTKKMIQIVESLKKSTGPLVETFVDNRTKLSRKRKNNRNKSDKRKQ